MKKPSLFLAALALFNAVSFSQDIRLQSCSNELISRQVDSLKNLYGKDGYVLLKEASMTMESEFEMPVIVPLTQGSWYQFVFIGEYSSRLYEVRMYDWQERQVIFRQKKRERDRLFLRSPILRVSYDETGAGQQKKEEEFMRIRNAVQTYTRCRNRRC